MEYRTTKPRYRYLKIYNRMQKELNDNEEKTDISCWDRYACCSLDIWFICIFSESR